MKLAGSLTVSAKVKRILTYVVLIIVTLITISPIVFLFITSFKENSLIVEPVPHWVFEPTLKHYKTVLGLSEFEFYHFLKNSIFVSFGSSILAILLSLPAAYSFARHNTGGGHLSFTILSLRIAPPVVFAVPFYLLLRTYGLLDSVTGLILAYLTFNLPISVWILKSFIEGVPRSIDEAALIDGASRFEVLWRMIVPLIAPGLMATFFINLIFSWNEFLFAFFLTSSEAKTLTVAIMGFITAYSIDWGNIAAATMLAMIPLIIAGIAMQRYLVRGLTLGAVKG